jgi:uncharacterized membrane protein YraQ (UPF0718 family)
MFVWLIWAAAALALVLSFFKNKEKTASSLRVSLKFFRSMALPTLLIIWTIGFILALLPAEIISRMIGREAGFKGVALAAVVGSIVLIQAFIAFPLAGSLLREGANISAIAAFVTTLVMVGIVTSPLEAKCFGKKFAFWRNFLSFLFALIIALIIGVVLR